MLKKLFFVTIVSVVCMSAGVTALANSEENVVLRFVMNSTTFTHDGVPRRADVAPFFDTANNRAMLPLRTIAEELDMTISWIESTQTVTLEKDGFSVSIIIDTPLPGGMGMPIIVNDHTMVPIRYIADAMNITVQWDEENNASIITVPSTLLAPTPAFTVSVAPLS